MEKHNKPLFEYNKINDYVYIGTNVCCQTHFNSSLLRKGIKADISLEMEKMDHPVGVKYFLWIPVKDHNAPTQEQLKIGANFLQNLVSNKIKTYVHCMMGHSRSVTLVAAYFILKGMKVNEAIESIRKQRPAAHLNKKQIKALEKFQSLV